MTRVGVAMTKGTGIGALLNHGVIHLAPNSRGTNGHIGRRQLLGKGHHVGRFNAHSRATEVIAGASKAGNYLIGPEHNIVLIKNCLHLRVIACGRHNNAAGAGNRLSDKGGDGIWAFTHNHVLEIADNAIDKFDFRFFTLLTAIIVRVIRAQYAQGIHWQIKVILCDRQSSERRSGHGHTMIGPLTGNNFTALWLADGFVVIAQQFDMGIVGITAGVAKGQHGILHRNHLRQFVGEIYGYLMSLTTKHMAKGELVHLLGGGIYELLIAITQGGAPEASQTLKIFITVFIPHITALTPFDGDLFNSLKVSCGIN